MSEMKYDCTSCTAKDFYFISVDKRFCTGCMRNFDKSLPSQVIAFWISPVAVWK